MVENSIYPILLDELTSSFTAKHYKRTIQLCKILFYIDPLNDKAFQYQIRALVNLKKGDEAKKRYHLFTVEYKMEIEKEYALSFVEIVK